MAVLALLTGASPSTPGDPVLLAAPSPRLTLTLRMTTTQALAPTTRLAMMDEAESIWDEGHIRLRWVDKDQEHDGDASLRVLVMARAVAAAGAESPWTVGELVRSEGAPAIAIASITGARRVVDETGRHQLLDEPMLRDWRLGLVLGRAVAHEIGHYLLQTSTHAPQGLMRARIEAREFADLRRATFRLDKAAQAHLAQLAARGTFSPDAADTTFSYATR